MPFLWSTFPNFLQFFIRSSYQFIIDCNLNFSLIWKCSLHILIGALLSLCIMETSSPPPKLNKFSRYEQTSASWCFFLFAIGSLSKMEGLCFYHEHPPQPCVWVKNRGKKTRQLNKTIFGVWVRWFYLHGWITNWWGQFSHLPNGA